MRASIRAAVVIVGLVGLGTLPAAGQTSANGSIRGYVRDQQKAVLPGATLTATSPAVPIPFTTTADAEGYYRLLELPPAEYTLTVELQGFARFVRPNLVVRAGLGLGVDVEMQLRGQAETVTIQSDTPMMEAQSAVQSVNIAGDFQRAVPLRNRKHWSDFLEMTPGIVGNGTQSLRGSALQSNSIQIDGADMASAQGTSTTLVNLSLEAIADVQVKIGALEASSPLGYGAAINIATKSGTNDFHGAASMFLQRKGWADNNNPGGTLNSVHAFLPEAALGGPLLRDRLWFFGAYRHERIISGLSRSAAQLAAVRALKPDFEPFDSEADSDFAFAKLSARLSSRHQGELSYSYDPRVSKGGTPIDAAQLSSRTDGGSRSFALRVSSVWSSSVSTRFGASYNNKTGRARAVNDLPNRTVYASVVPSGGRLLGSGGVIAQLDNSGNSFDSPTYKSTLSGDVTWFKQGFLGSHELQAGLQFQPREHYETAFYYVNGGFSREEVVLRNPQDPAQGFVPFHREIFDVTSVTTALSDARDFAFYLQDAWRPTERLALSLGIRADAIRRVDRLFDKVVQDKVDFGPRLGLNYALSRDRKNMVRASWVRAHDAISTNAVAAGSNTAGKRDLYDTNLDGVFETTLVTPASTALAPNRVFDLERGQPYVNEWALGFRRQFPGRLMLDAAVIRREYRARTAFVDQNGIYENGVFGGYRDERQNEIYLLTSNTWNWQVYSGLELQVVKDAARARFLGSYTRAWRHMAGTWQPNDPASHIQPGAFPNDKNLGFTRHLPQVALDANSLSGTHMTEEAFAWQDHVARLGVTYDAPAGFEIASAYSFHSGAYGGPVVTRIAAADPGFGPPTVTLSNGRVVANPLATTIRFAHPTRGEGQFKAPWLHIWNLRIGRTLKLSKSSNLQLALEAFNVLNADSDQYFQSGANQQFSPNYGRTAMRQQPRMFGVSARLAF